MLPETDAQRSEIFSAGSGADIAPLAAMANSNGSKRLCVLVVDDQPDAADTVAALLCLMGYDAHAVYSGRQALQRFMELHPSVVLMDLGMPEMSGFEAAARIRMMPQGTSTAIVALTASGDEVNRHLSHEASIDYHVVKPAAAETLQEVLRRIRVH